MAVGCQPADMRGIVTPSNISLKLRRFGLTPALQWASKYWPRFLALASASGETEAATGQMAHAWANIMEALSVTVV